LIEDGQLSTIAVGICALSIGIKEGLYRMTRRVAEQMGSNVLMANAWHHRADALGSSFALTGVLGRVFLHSAFDPLAGAIVAGVIVKVSIDIFRRALEELLDTQLDDPTRHKLNIAVESVLRELSMAEPWNGIGPTVQHLGGRRAGPDLHLQVELALTTGPSAWDTVSARQVVAAEAALRDAIQARGLGAVRDIRIVLR